MNIGILGAGNVGKALAVGFKQIGNNVKVGTRNPKKYQAWAAESKIDVVTFEQSASFGDLLVLCTNWSGTENAINMAQHHNFTNKILIDVTNPLVFAQEGKLPHLSLAYPESAGKHVQELLPKAKVVKTLNIITAARMTNPMCKEGTASMFLCGNDEEAKNTVTSLLKQWGWSVTDLGGIEQAYLMEALAMVWITIFFNTQSWTHAFSLLKE